MNKKFSILICSLSSRTEKLNRLMNVLRPQLTNEVEVLVKSDGGEANIGSKRNALLNESKGEYVAFVDDDDLVSDDYVSKILTAVRSKPDCCGLQGIITFQGQNPKLFIHSLKYKQWFEQNNIYYRCPNHLNAIKRELAIATKFPESNFGEDKDFSTRLLPLLKEEVFISGVIYHYLYEKGGPPNSPTSPNNSIIHPRVRGWR